MENQEDVDEIISEIMQDENQTWTEKKVAIAMVAIIRRKGEMTDEEIDKELGELKVWDMDDLEFKNFVDAMTNIYPLMEN